MLHPQVRHSIRFPAILRWVPFKQWSEDDLKPAAKAVSDGWTIRRAAEESGVPKSTLYDRVSDRMAFGAKSGPPRYLTDGEKELTNFLVGCARIGYARSRKQVISLVRGIVAKKTGTKLEVTEMSPTTDSANCKPSCLLTCCCP